MNTAWFNLTKNTKILASYRSLLDGRDCTMKKQKTINEKRVNILLLKLGTRLWFVKVDIVDDTNNNVVNKKLIYKVKSFKFRSNVSIFRIAHFNCRNCKYRVEIIFVRLATHLRFYVGTLDCQIQIWQFKSQNKLNCHYP
jgi:CRISPR/Cas system CSM-associated protein Csm4 (group 5 of RAMP superfamily)